MEIISNISDENALLSVLRYKSKQLPYIKYQLKIWTILHREIDNGIVYKEIIINFNFDDACFYRRYL
jgi:hypothetical protein